MSAFLWVEDFDGGTDETLQVTTGNVFGLPADNSSSNDWTDVLDVRDYLATKRIFLETSLIDALNFLADPQKLASIDYVILDIDLRISADPEDENGNLNLERLLLWHGPGTTIDECKEQRIRLRKIAGYHLWTQLVIDLGFPRDRIQFCSNHGKYLETIQESFTSARIQPPDVFTKSDGLIKDWITEQSKQSYTALRRNVIDYCSLILKQLKSEQDYSLAMLRLSKLPGLSTKDFKKDNAIEMLEMLPLYLPPIITDENETAIMRAFVRAFSMEWERFNASQKCMENADKASKDDFNESINYLYKIENHSIKSSATVLKLLRNSFSHGLNHININCNQVAQFFLLNMRTIFLINDTDELCAIEKMLLAKSEFDDIFNLAESHNKSMQQFKRTAKSLSGLDGWAMGQLLRPLQFSGNPYFYRHAPEFLLSFLWHELTFKFSDKEQFHEEFKRISESSDPIHRVAMSCVGGSNFLPTH